MLWSPAGLMMTGVPQSSDIFWPTLFPQPIEHGGFIWSTLMGNLICVSWNVYELDQQPIWFSNQLQISDHTACYHRLVPKTSWDMYDLYPTVTSHIIPHKFGNFWRFMHPRAQPSPANIHNPKHRSNSAARVSAANSPATWAMDIHGPWQDSWTWSYFSNKNGDMVNRGFHKWSYPKMVGLS